MLGLNHLPKGVIANSTAMCMWLGVAHKTPRSVPARRAAQTTAKPCNDARKARSDALGKALGPLHPRLTGMLKHLLQRCAVAGLHPLRQLRQPGLIGAQI